MEEYLICCRTPVTDTVFLHYRDCLREGEEGAYGILRRERPQLTREEMEHVRERLTMIHQSLLETRRKQILSLCLRRKIEVNNRLLKGLEKRQHHDSELFSGNDLRGAETPVLMDENREQDVSLGLKEL